MLRALEDPTTPVGDRTVAPLAKRILADGADADTVFRRLLTSAVVQAVGAAGKPQLDQIVAAVRTLAGEHPGEKPDITVPAKGKEVSK